MNLLEEAICFAVRAHAGTLRKDGETPYILHPMEAAAICGTLTADEAVLAAAVLHDTVEDTDVTPSEIRARFGERVAALVASETEDKYPQLPPEVSWQQRKAESLRELAATDDRGVKILWLGDKLSNMRSFYRQWQAEGAAMWRRYHQQNPARQAWYYRSIAKALEELKDTPAWQEYHFLTEAVFGEVRPDE